MLFAGLLLVMIGTFMIRGSFILPMLGGALMLAALATMVFTKS